MAVVPRSHTVIVMGKIPIMVEGKITKSFLAILIFSIIGGSVGLIFVMPQEIFQPELQIYSARFTGEIHEQGHRIIEITIVNNDDIDYEMIDIFLEIKEERTWNGATETSGHGEPWRRSGVLNAGERDTREFREPDPYSSDEEGSFFIIVSISYDDEEMDSQKVPYSYEPKRYFGLGIILILVSWSSVAVLLTVYFKERSKFIKSLKK